MRGLHVLAARYPARSLTSRSGPFVFREFPVDDQVGEPFQRSQVCRSCLWVSRVCVALLRPFKFFSTECAFPSQSSVREVYHGPMITGTYLRFVSRQSEKFLSGQSRKFLLTAVRLEDGTNRDEPTGTG